MLRVKILNVFRADYGVCCTILIYPAESVLSEYRCVSSPSNHYRNRIIGSYTGELFLYRPL